MKKANLVRVILPVIILFGTLFCVHNGVVVSKMPDMAKEPDSIIMFYVISLFTFGAKDFGAPIAGPWVLQMMMWVFYFTAPLITLIAMADILSVIRPVFIRYILHFRPYYLILGYGRIGKSAMSAIQDRLGKKSYMLILDKNSDESGNDFSVIFEHILVLNKNLTEPSSWKEYVTSRCKGVYILTDQELLNLRIYNELKTYLQEMNIAEMEVFTRIRSLEISHRVGDIHEENANKYTKNRPKNHHFLNIHVAAPHLIYNYQEVMKKVIPNDPIVIHYQKQVARFRTIMQHNFDSFVFVGFGTFSSSFLKHLHDEKIISPTNKLIIIDPHAQKNWGSYVLDKYEMAQYDPKLMEKDFETLVDSALVPELNVTGRNTLCFFSTNNEERNIQSASYFTRKFNKDGQVFSIIRTKYMDVMQPELMDDLIGIDQWMMVPTYTWIKLSFEYKIN